MLTTSMFSLFFLHFSFYKSIYLINSLSPATALNLDPHIEFSSQTLKKFMNSEDFACQACPPKFTWLKFCYLGLCLLQSRDGAWKKRHLENFVGKKRKTWVCMHRLFKETVLVLLSSFSLYLQATESNTWEYLVYTNLKISFSRCYYICTFKDRFDNFSQVQLVCRGVWCEPSIFLCTFRRGKGLITSIYVGWVTDHQRTNKNLQMCKLIQDNRIVGFLPLFGVQSSKASSLSFFFLSSVLLTVVPIYVQIGTIK